ncbi:bifunctional lysylphosphatidylglycerol synthetase/lysine--tRNA ligase LysX [Saccharopolyspora sp. MS10]|uniref:bifunctional lysylphosphatidylglycerol synthetase/lysine--tRNA ligase LysX n=1 Tax=Saccharopolyspora sp. MS10 TaxID=3385973 RepID=UPI00399FC294
MVGARASWGPAVAVAVTALVQLGACVSAVLLVRDGHDAFARWTVFLFGLVNVPVAGNVVNVLVLVVLGAALRGRKRAALNTLLLFQFGGLATSVGTHVAAPRVPGLAEPGQLAGRPAGAGALAAEALIALGTAALLATARPAFPARLAPGAWRHALLVCVGGIVAVVLAGWGLTEAFPGTVAGTSDRFWWAADRSVGGLLGLHRVGAGTGPAWLDLLLDLAATSVLGAALYAFFRGTRRRRRRTDEDEIRLRTLLAEHGEPDSLGYFATRRDKNVLFSPDGGAAITYQVIGGASIASADPVGDPGAWPRAVRAWLEEARTYGWTPGALGAGERAARLYSDFGLRALELGDEAVLRVRDFQLSGPGRGALRQAVHRVERAGYTARLRRHADIPRAEMADLLAVAQRWRRDRAERGFSMALSRLGDPTDGRCLMLEARDAGGGLRALMSFVPWGRRGASLDLMRRDPGADNGLNEYLIACLMAEAPRFGIRRVSLNFAMFRSVFASGERLGAGPVLRAWRAVLTVPSRFYQLESLYRANAKYDPDWVPRFLCYPAARSLTRVALAAGALEGFLPAGRRLPRGVTPAGAVQDDLVAGVREVEAAAERAAAAPPRDGPERRRLERLRHLRDAGVEPYPATFARNTTVEDLVAEFGGLPPDSHTAREVVVAGRVTAIRDLGGVCFAVLDDSTGSVQVLLDSAVLGPWRDHVDTGDHVGIRGEVITTRRGELSVRARSWTMTAKSLRPPRAARGRGTRSRPRHLVRGSAPDPVQVLRARGALVAALREVLREHGHVEAEPVAAQGTSAELGALVSLARMRAAGAERVFALRFGDGEDPWESASLRAYEAYVGEAGMRELVVDLLRAATIAVFGSAAADDWPPRSLTADRPVLDVREAVSRALGLPGGSTAALRAACRSAGVRVDDDDPPGRMVARAFDELVRPRTVEPTWCAGHPADDGRDDRFAPRPVGRAELVVRGARLACTGTEPSDPLARRAHLRDRLLSEAEDEAGERLLSALEDGIPPAGVLDLDVGRLLVLLIGTG